MKYFCWFTVCALIFVVSLTSCGQAPVVPDESSGVESNLARVTYENADKLGTEQASKLFHTLGQLAPVSGWFGGGGGASGGYAGGSGGGIYAGGGGVYGGYSGGPSGGPYVSSGGGSVNPTVQMKVEDKTTEEIWQKFKVQVFTFNNKTYLVRDKLFVHVYNFAFQKYCIVDFNENGIPELVFFASFNNYGIGSYVPYDLINIHTEDTEIRNIDLMPEITHIANFNNIEAVNDVTVKLTGDKQYLLTCNFDKANPAFVLTELTEEK